MPVATGLAGLVHTLLLISGPSAHAAQDSVPSSAGQAIAERQQLPYAPPPVMGFGGVLCAPVLACAPSTPATQAATPRSESQAHADQRRLLYEQTRPQNQVPFNPTDFDKYVGYYEFDFLDGTVFTGVYRSGNRYYWQVESAGQRPTEVFPESAAEFFATEFAAQLSFATGTDGNVTEMILHENGVLHAARRASQAAYDAWLNNLHQRIAADKPSPGTDVVVRRQINAWESLAAANHVPHGPILTTIQNLGAFGTLKFVRVGPHGWDVYEATFSNGRLQCFVAPLSSKGKVSGLECH